MKNSRVFLLLGSNVGDTFFNLKCAKEHIGAMAGDLGIVSSLYETEPWGYADEKEYLNQVIELNTHLSPAKLLQAILQVEKMLGREKSVEYSSRIIDIDILFYNDEVIREPGLIIPHPLFQERNFALFPMAEIASGYIHPVLQKTIGELLLLCCDTKKVRRRIT